METKQSSYRQIFKATSLFGGVQVINILISVVRSKIIAVLLGPTGMGIAGLLTSTTGLIAGITNLGLGTSAVRNVAAANENGDILRVSKVVIIFRRLIWITGLLGSFVTFGLAPMLSDLTFGNDEYTLAFRYISITLLFNQLASGNNVLMQGLRKLKDLAKANLAGSLVGLVVSVPIYYFWRLEGIVPAIIISSVLTFLVVWYFASKTKIERTEVSREETFREGRDMVEMGFMFSLSGLITLASSYIIRVYISNAGTIEDVGFYSAGFTIINSYVGMVFTAMSADYYPRLAGVAHDNSKATSLINQQAEVATLILAPILTIFLIFINFMVILLYSEEFSPVNGMIHWAALGMYFKAASWSIGFIMLAKGASKVFFWSELLANTYLLGLNIVGYRFFDLDGLGMAFLVGYILVLIQVFLIAKIKYKFSFSTEFIKVFVIQFALGIGCFLIIKLIEVPYAYFAGVPIFLISSLLSLRELDRQMDLKKILLSRLKGKN